MQRFLLFSMLPMLTAAAELQVDHVSVAGRDLKAMQANLSAVGIPSEYGGPHSNHATEMALASFPDGSYLELIAIQSNADPKALAAHYWSKQLQGNAGPTAWAVRSKDVGAEVKRLETASVAVKQPVRSGRDRPDGFKLDWEAAQVGPEPNGTFFPFLIHDFTPRQKRAYPSGKPTTTDFSGIAKVVIVVRDLQAAAKRFEQAYGLQAPIQQVDADFGAHLALLGGTPAVLAAPLTDQGWLAERLNKFGEGPCAFILRGRKTAAYHAVSKTRWFGVSVSWLDADKLGWHLGFE